MMVLRDLSGVYTPQGLSFQATIVMSLNMKLGKCAAYKILSPYVYNHHK